jgi:hypothetical protein
MAWMPSFSCWTNSSRREVLYRREFTMNAAARKTLTELRSLGNIERYLNAAKAELASDPCDERLHAFIELIEGLLRDEKAKLVAQ